MNKTMTGCLTVALAVSGCLVLVSGSAHAQTRTKITPAAAQPRPPVVPVISAVTASVITSDSATITWTTDIPSDSQIEYGSKAGQYVGSTTLDPAYVTAHSQTISGLVPYTLYHFRVDSSSGPVNRAVSGDYVFTTLPPKTPPAIGTVTVPDLRATIAVIVWSTNTPTDTQVDYGLSAGYGFSSDLKPALGTFHGIRLVGLTPQTQYHYRVKSTDYWGNKVVSDDLTFQTGAPPADGVYDLFYPRVGLDGGTYTGVALTDLNVSAATLQYSAFDPAGMPVIASSPVLPSTNTLAPGSQAPVVDSQIFGSGNPDPTLPGWARIRTVGTKPVGFYLTFNSNLTQMDGTAISADLPRTFVFPEAVAQDYTRIALSNPDIDPASVTIDLLKADGSIHKEVQTSIQGYGTLFADLYGDLFAGTLPVVSEYVRVASDKGLIAYEYFGRNGTDFATLAGQDVSGGASTLYSPQYVQGGPWQTTISVVNLSTIGGTVSLSLFGDDGSQIGVTKTAILDAGGKLSVSGTAYFGNDPATSTQAVQGYVVVTGTGIRLAGSVVFGDALSQRFSSSLPLVPTLQRSLVFSQVASSDTYFTGLAIVNPNPAAATAQIDLYSSDGTLQNSVTQAIGAGRRVSRLLTDYFPALVGQTRLSGYIKVTVDQDVACFGVLGTNNLSVLSAIPAQPAQ